MLSFKLYAKFWVIYLKLKIIFPSTTISNRVLLINVSYLDFLYKSVFLNLTKLDTIFDENHYFNVFLNVHFSIMQNVVQILKRLPIEKKNILTTFKL